MSLNNQQILAGSSLWDMFSLGCPANIRFEVNISKYEINIYSLQSKLNRFYSFYSLVLHLSKSADFTCETNILFIFFLQSEHF
jgi:hypothetical protein